MKIYSLNILKDDNFKKVEADITDVLEVFEKIMSKVENKKEYRIPNYKNSKIKCYEYTYYENDEKEFITTDNISYVRFYAISRPRGRKDRNPTLQIFDSEEKKLVEMTIKPIDYHSLKKYFEKYNVRIDNQYKEF